jgi:predicted  nucleic acid-binding Zn-ribbon protein
MDTSENNNGKNKKILPILLILLIVSAGLNVYFLLTTSNQKQVITETKAEVEVLNNFKRTLENDFQAMTFELDQFKGKNIELDSLLQRANTDLEKQKMRIESLIKDNKDIDLLKRQLGEMRAIRDQYRVEIDKLIKENKELRFANINLTQEVESLNQTTKDLNEKVETASVLRVEGLSIKTFREKGKGKLEETDKAKRITKINTLFVLADNKVAKKGNRDIVLRIIKPDGYVLSDANNGSGTFKRSDDGRNVDYTSRKQFYYDNERSEISFEWDQLEELRSGLYIAEMYVDGRLSGTNKFNLK